MRDYAELVKALRCCSKIDARNNGCDSCPYEYCGEDCQNLCGYAADAIEELLKKNAELDNSGRVLVAAFARLKEKVPHWISVEERLPNLGQKVLTIGQRGDLDCSKYIGLVGVKRTDWKNWHWQQYEAKKIRYWMPADSLPAPPKEDAE